MTGISDPSFLEDYDVETVSLRVAKRGFRFYVPRTLDPIVDLEDPLKNFPLWAKIWEASLVLAHALANQRPVEGARILEIGAGLGVAGVVGASFGHHITVTDNNPDALRFARANARLNLEGEALERLSVKALDWTKPQCNETYDQIVGSETLYREKDTATLLKLFALCLRPGGEVLLCEGFRKTSLSFFERAQEQYNVEARKITLRSPGRTFEGILARLRPRLREQGPAGAP